MSSFSHCHQGENESDAGSISLSSSRGLGRGCNVVVIGERLSAMACCCH